MPTPSRTPPPGPQPQVMNSATTRYNTALKNLQMKIQALDSQANPGGGRYRYRQPLPEQLNVAASQLENAARAITGLRS